MIFIIIAVIVLFISFVIALFSLVREQKKIEKVEELGTSKPVDVQASVEQTLSVENIAVNNPETSMASAEVKEHISEPQQPLVEQEDRFPWEAEPRVSDTGNSELDEIEKIRAEIARMQKPSDANEDVPVVTQEPVGVNEKLDSRLNGEFQIRRDN